MTQLLKFTIQVSGALKIRVCQETNGLVCTYISEMMSTELAVSIKDYNYFLTFCQRERKIVSKQRVFQTLWAVKEVIVNRRLRLDFMVL